MGKPNGKSMALPSYVMSYGKNKLRPEFWFSVPKNRIDELYRFLNTWVPQLYGELDEEAIQERGFELIQHDTEWIKGGPHKVYNCFHFSDIEHFHHMLKCAFYLMNVFFLHFVLGWSISK